jgi:hypothetical protein
MISSVARAVSATSPPRNDDSIDNPFEIVLAALDAWFTPLARVAAAGN